MNTDGAGVDLSGRVTNQQRLYVSFNPVPIPGTARDSPTYTHLNITYNASYIQSFSYGTGLCQPLLQDSSIDLFMLLSSPASAGPVAIDHSESYLYFIDANPTDPFIGRVSLYDVYNSDAISSTTMRYNSSLPYRWLTLSPTHTVQDFTLDVALGRRRVYWAVPGVSHTADGAIYYANMDDSLPTAYSLVTAIGQSNLVDPTGLSIDFPSARLMWKDVVYVNTQFYPVLRSSDLDGTDVKDVVVYNSYTDPTVPALHTNVTDLIVDFYHNNTAFFFSQLVSTLLHYYLYTIPIHYTSLLTYHYACRPTEKAASSRPT